MVLYLDGQSYSTNKEFKWSTRFVPIQSFHEITGRNQSQNSQNLAVTNPDTKDAREEWVISIKDKMEATRGYYATTTWNELCNYRVPHHLQENDEKSYFPQIVSIGLYHHCHKHLMPMEYHKWRAVNKVMEWTTHSIKMYIDAMEKLEKKARACYEGRIDMTSNKFTEMLVLDGCFVLELFRGTINGFSEIRYAPHDPVFGMQRLMHLIQRDMVMLENQLPLFVMDRVLELHLGIPNKTGIVAKAAVKFFEPLVPTGEEVTTPDQSEVMRGREEVVKSYTSGRKTRQRQLAIMSCCTVWMFSIEVSFRRLILRRRRMRILDAGRYGIT